MIREPRSALTHRQWMGIATEEYRRIAELLDTLSETQWRTPTDCSGWTVRDIVAHLIGGAEATASIGEQLRQQRLGRTRRGQRPQLDVVNDIHVEERAACSVAELRDHFGDATRRSLRARGRIPAIVRAPRFPAPPPVGLVSLGFLYDIVYTRDAWMHRVDICRAIGTPLTFTADHDALIVTDAARAWRHLTDAKGCVLTAPTGEQWTVGSDSAAQVPAYDAIDFARALSGRGELPGISSHVVLF